MIDVAQIEMVEADRNYVTLHIGSNTFQARTTLQQAEEAMRSQPMLRISRSCLVNINHVSAVNRTLCVETSFWSLEGEPRFQAAKAIATRCAHTWRR